MKHVYKLIGLCLMLLCMSTGSLYAQGDILNMDDILAEEQDQKKELAVKQAELDRIAKEQKAKDAKIIATQQANKRASNQRLAEAKRMKQQSDNQITTRKDSDTGEPKNPMYVTILFVLAGILIVGGITYQFMWKKKMTSEAGLSKKKKVFEAPKVLPSSSNIKIDSRGEASLPTTPSKPPTPSKDKTTPRKPPQRPEHPKAVAPKVVSEKQIVSDSVISMEEATKKDELGRNRSGLIVDEDMFFADRQDEFVDEDFAPTPDSNEDVKNS